jgi:hypothetical protein
MVKNIGRHRNSWEQMRWANNHSLKRSNFFFLLGSWGCSTFEFLLFPMCSHQVPFEFPIAPHFILCNVIILGIKYATHGNKTINWYWKWWQSLFLIMVMWVFCCQHCEVAEVVIIHNLISPDLVTNFFWHTSVFFGNLMELRIKSGDF